MRLNCSFLVHVSQLLFLGACVSIALSWCLCLNCSFLVLVSVYIKLSFLVIRVGRMSGADSVCVCSLLASGGWCRQALMAKESTDRGMGARV